MAIIVVSVLILIALIVTVIGFKIQETNAIVEEVNNQIIYTKSLSKHVDGIIDRVIKYDTFREVDKVNWGLGLYGHTNPSEKRCVYYEPLYKYYREGDSNNPNLKYDVRWLWLTYYMRDVYTIFPQLKDYVENMELPPYIRNQTFVYNDGFKFFPLGNRPQDYYKKRLEIIPDFYVYKNLMFTPTLYGFKITTSNYTVVVNSKAVITTDQKTGVSEIDFKGKNGKTPMFVSRDVHAGEFYVDFRIIQMYNALLFEHLLFSRNLNMATSKFAYTYVIPNDKEDAGNSLFDQLIDKIPYPTGKFQPLVVSPLAQYEVCSGSTVESNLVGKYGIPVCGLTAKPVYNFDWLVYNILFTPPYYMDTEHIKYRHDKDYDLLLGLPVSMYSPITNYQGNVYVGNTQFAMLPKSTIQNLLLSTNKNQLSAEVLYVILDAIAHNKESVFSGKGVRTITIYAYPEAGYGIKFSAVDGDTSRTYYIPVYDTETIIKNEGLIRKTVNQQLYFGLVWVSQYTNCPQFIVDVKTGKFIPLTMLYNAYILSHNPELREFLRNPKPNGILKRGYPLSNGASYDYLAMPYTTLLNTRLEELGHTTILDYLTVKKPGIIFTDLTQYKDEINFLDENIIKPTTYSDSNVFWSYILYSFGLLHSADFGEIKTMQRNNLPSLLHSGLVGMYQPIALVHRDGEYPDFPDAIQVWWFPAVKERGATSDYNTVNEKMHYDDYDYKTSEQFSGSTVVRLTKSRSASLIDIVGNENYFKPSNNKEEEKLKIMMSNISISRPVITDIKYRVDSVKIHYYYKPVEIYAHPYTVSMHQTMKHPYSCNKYNSECCIRWKPVWDNTTNQTVEVCVQHAPIWYTTKYGSRYKESRSAPYQFSIFPDTIDSYKLKIFKDFDKGNEMILGNGFTGDIPKWKKIMATYPSDNKYYTKWFFIKSATSHPNHCGCDDDYGEWRFDVDYKKVMMNKYEEYYIVEVAEVDLTLMLTYDLYATDLRFIDEYLNSYRSGVYRGGMMKQYPSYGVLYYTSRGFDDHISLVSDGFPPMIIKHDPNYYLSYNNLFSPHYSMIKNDNRDYIDPNFLIAKHLYVKSRFTTFVHVKLYIVTRFWYGSPGRLNSAYMQAYLNGGGYYSETAFSHEKYDITAYITNPNQYKLQAISLLPKYYYNVDYLQAYGIPVLLAPSPAEGEPMINLPLGVPPGISVDWVAVTKDFEPVIDLG